MTGLLRPPAWSWDDARRRAGIGAAGAFNAGTLSYESVVKWRRADGRDEVLDHGAFDALVSRISGTLGYMGVRAGDRVAGFLGRRPEALAAAVATWRIGAVYVPLFTSFGVEALETRLSDSGAKVVITDGANRSALERVQPRVGDLEALTLDGTPGSGDTTLVDMPPPAVAETTAEDPATIVYTSGTTSKPKGCVMPHRSLLNLWPYVLHGLRLEENDVLFSSADPGWSFGLLTTGLAPMSLGHTRCLFEGPFDVTQWCEAISDWEVTHFATAPTGLRQLMTSDAVDIASLRNLKSIVTAGEALTPDIATWCRDELGVVVRNSYGLTELGMLTANGEHGEDEDSLLALGHPLPGFDLSVVDGSANLLPPGSVGRLAVKDNGHFLSSGYWGREAEWKARLHDGWWVTEDVVRQAEDGRFWYVDRSDDVIVTAGYNVSPGEVERVILANQWVVDAACVAAPDSRKGHVVVAHVVLGSTPAPPGLLDEVREMVGGTIGWHAAPRRLVVADSLPRTESGKLRRRALRDRAEPETRGDL